MLESVAVDIGGTKTAAALVRDSIILEYREKPTPASDGPEAITTHLLTLVEDWIPTVSSINVAVTGVVYQGTVTSLNERTFPGWDQYPLQALLQQRTGRKITILNDAQAAAWGDYRFGAGRGKASIVFITVSTGVGSGIVYHGKLLTGTVGLAGHLGYTFCAAAKDALGIPQVLEDHASGHAIGRAASTLCKQTLTAKDVFEKARAQEDWAVDIVQEATRKLAIAIWKR